MLDQKPPRLPTGSLRSGTITTFMVILGIGILPHLTAIAGVFMMNVCMNAE